MPLNELSHVYFRIFLSKYAFCHFYELGDSHKTEVKLSQVKHERNVARTPPPPPPSGAGVVVGEVRDSEVLIPHSHPSQKLIRSCSTLMGFCPSLNMFKCCLIKHGLKLFSSWKLLTDV